MAPKRLEAFSGAHLVALRNLEVFLDHFRDQLLKTDLRAPSEQAMRLAGIAWQFFRPWRCAFMCAIFL